LFNVDLLMMMLPLDLESKEKSIREKNSWRAGKEVAEAEQARAPVILMAFKSI
jgi:hypothetical protein